jgi:hypothetical protein
MSCVAFWPSGTHRNETPRGRRGFRSSAHAKDTLWSVDLFRCESAVLRALGARLVVMDHYTRRIIGFGVHVGAVDGVGLCRMFNRATRGDTLPKYLSSDHDRLFEFHRWQANLRILDVDEIKTSITRRGERQLAAREADWQRDAGIVTRFYKLSKALK